jgi:hypothetical protein
VAEGLIVKEDGLERMGPVFISISILDGGCELIPLPTQSRNPNLD